MPARVLAESVKELIDTSRSDDLVMAHMVDTANLYVNTHLSTAGHTEAVLEKIELYLAAHILALVEERGGLKGSKMGDASEFLSDVYSEGFRSTRFGQLALALDTTGILARIGSPGLKAEFRVV